MSNYIQEDQHMMTVGEELEDLGRQVDQLRKRAERETNIRMSEFIEERDSANKTWSPFVTAVDDLKRVEQIISTLKFLNLYDSDITPMEKRVKSKTKTRKTKSIRRNKPLGFYKENSTYQTKSSPESSSGVARALRRTRPAKKRARPVSRTRPVKKRTIARRRWTKQEVKRLRKALREADKSLPPGEYYKEVYQIFGPTFRTIPAVRKKAYSLGIYLKEE